MALYDTIELSPGMRSNKATARIPAGTVVQDLKVFPVIPNNDRHAITKTLTEYFDTTGHPITYTNHSCDPNLRIDFQTWSLVAARDIQPGEELSFNYLTSEYTMAEEFNCICGSPKCFKSLKGFSGLTSDAKAQLLPHCAPYIHELEKHKQVAS